MPVKTTAKQDLVTYKELKNIKSEFDKEMKNAKDAIKNNNITNAKSRLNNCGKYITNMEKSIDKLPDESRVDTIKALVPSIVAILGSVIATSINSAVTSNDIKKINSKWREDTKSILKKYDDANKDIDKKYDKKREDLLDEREKIFNKKDEVKNIYYAYMDVHGKKGLRDEAKSEKYYDALNKPHSYSDEKRYNYLMDKADKAAELRNKKLKELQSELDEVRKEYDKKVSNINKRIWIDIEDERRNEKDSNILKQREEINKLGNILDKIDKRGEKQTDTDCKIIGGSLVAGTVGTLLSLKPLKSKAKSILNKCKKELDNTRAYLDKIEKMGKNVKESFDEVLDDLCITYVEGYIDEFEYDTLVDHLLN